MIFFPQIDKMINIYIVENYFLVNTNELIPHRYHVDIRVRQNMELIYHRNMLEFDIVNDVTNYYN